VFATLARAAGNGDWSAARECFAPDAVVHHHALTGFGEGDRDLLIQWFAEERAAAHDVRREFFRIAAWNDRGRADLFRAHGTLRAGGAYENALVRVVVGDAGGVRHLDIFPIERLDEAIARLAELTRRTEP
jgi:hypothetical protein